MSRLPKPGADAGQWGDILNEYLSTSHNTDGTLKDNVVGSAQLKDNAVTETTLSSSVQTKLNQTAPVTKVNNQTGDITLTKTDIGLSNVDNTADTAKPVSTIQQAALDLKADTTALTGKLNTSDLDAQTAAKITTDGTATQAALSSTYVTPVGSNAVVSIATPDGNSDVTHPSVVRTSAPWNGHRYWMAITGMPEARENPMVFCSNDGSTWVPPAGLTNPVFPLSWAEAKGYQYQSDTSLTLINGVMWMLWRTVNNVTFKEAVWLSKSTDGVAWSTPTTYLWEATTDSTVRASLSPSLVVLPTSGNLAIFTVHSVDGTLAGSVLVEKRVSTDSGVTWGSPVTCTVPELFNSSVLNSGLWHLEVRSHAGQLHLLGYAQTGNLHYWTSNDDGATWSGNRTPLFGRDATPITQFYRSSFQPSTSGDGWDVWAADWTTKRIRLFRNVDMAAGAPDLRLGRGIWLPTELLSTSLGALTTLLPAGNARLMGWRLAENALGRVTATIMRPPGWRRLRATLYWVNDGAAGVGNVYWSAASAAYAPGDIPASLGTTHDSQGSVRIVAAGALGELMRTVMSVPGTDNSPGEFTVILISRDGVQATDTLENRVLLLGVYIEPC